MRVRSCDIVHRVSESSFGNVEKTGDGGDVMGILPGGFGFAALASPFFVFLRDLNAVARRYSGLEWIETGCCRVRLKVSAAIEGVEWIEEAERGPERGMKRRSERSGSGKWQWSEGWGSMRDEVERQEGRAVRSV